MKNMVYIIIILFVLPCLTSAGEIYTYKNKQGVTVISNEPPPDEIKDKAKKVESYTPDSPAAIAAFQRKQKEEEDRAFRGWQSSQNNSTPTKSVQTSTYDKSQNKRQEIMDKTDRLKKEYWDEVERCRQSKCQVNKNLRDEYFKAIKEDPRTITTTTTTTFKRSRR